MLDTDIKTQLKNYLERLQQPIELVASLDDGEKSIETRDLLREIATLSPLVTVREDGEDARTPSFSVGRAGEAARIRFAGIPMGHEFTSLVLALLQAGGHPPKVDASVIEQIRAIDAGIGRYRFETYISLSCHNCPDVVQALNLMAVLNPGVESVMIDGALFQHEIDERKIMAVPTVYLNGEVFGQGRMTLEEIVAKIDTGAAAGSNRNVLFTCLGSPSRPQFDLEGPVALQSGDRILLCSDGLWDSLGQSDIVAQLSAKPVEQAVPDLVQAALQKAGPDSDNVSAIALEWESAEAA